ncbi:hypothetical protein C8J55DRAFT_530429 [Lentinula edodes]|uniref:WW domain-containing protein n=1 Tax=Lentinula lateritia TaxID=40482 RepID=A0A9W8ZS61_9AGAR|nr:hypothetical protein C8J55DRAFT_530429 [Lentinula edodes]
MLRVVVCTLTSTCRLHPTPAVALIPNSNSNQASASPDTRTTREPWIRRLADDGLSYYYLNVDGGVPWTRPEFLTSCGSRLPETPSYAVEHAIVG